jgi:pyridoxal/pyridoxine/pyridoxamine kinase
MHQPVRKVADPYAETDVHYLVVGADSLQPNIVEVEKGTRESFRTLQEAKNHAMRLLRERIEEATDSLSRIRGIGVEIPRLM